MSVTHQRMALIFNEWARRYSEAPESFSSILDDQGKPVSDYGECCAIYFAKIGLEMDAAGLLPKEDRASAPAPHIMPTIGRIVYHRGSDGQIRPAIVTHVWGEFCINAMVFPKDSSDKEAGIKTSLTHADPAQEPGCLNSWHWMPYQIATAKTAVILAPTPPSTPEDISVSDK
jgi:hypothetical protein